MNPVLPPAADTAVDPVSPPRTGPLSAVPAVPAGPTVPAVTPAPVHVRAVITWLAIFPLVSIGMLALNPLWGDWHPILRALLLTAIVVPLAVYLVVPRLLRGHDALRSRARTRTGTR